MFFTIEPIFILQVKNYLMFNVVTLDNNVLLISVVVDTRTWSQLTLVSMSAKADSHH